ncbi:unnamed protein product [Bursaphelenchus xylophilus]|uniref:(pine wood nematode) hypothetical protein n=1 Tax=Bursaphelenchus xylophilus TaxID=6326 RepID=A0A7I8WRV8_BURXY|nr:unnamed protein product [Bursaphelenchus xylophilus]CAG9114979.1 unnamed protein product [Bursaphelenchus xylophilus]
MMRRRTYEFERSNLAPKIIGTVLLIGAVEVLIKIILYRLFDTSDPVQDRFEKAVHAIKSPGYIMFSLGMYLLSLIAGFTLYFQSTQYLKKFRSQSQSLSESFEVNQTKKIVKIMWPLLIAYFLCGLIFSPICIVAFRILVFGSSPMWEKFFVLSQKFGLMARSPEIAPVLVIAPTDEHEDHFAYLRATWN